MAVLLSDGTVVLSPRDSALLVYREPEILAGWARNGLVPSDAKATLVVLREAAAGACLAEPPHRGLVPVSRVAVAGFVAAGSEVSVKEAAERLHISEQAVTKAVRVGRLSGSRVGRSPWRIAACSVDEYPTRHDDNDREVPTMYVMTLKDGRRFRVRSEPEGSDAELEELSPAEYDAFVQQIGGAACDRASCDWPVSAS